MNSEELEDLRARVERRRLAGKKAELEDELNGRHNEVDSEVLYMSVKEVAAQFSTSVSTVAALIHEGRMPNAIKSRGGGVGVGGGSWALHPDDVAKQAPLFGIKRMIDGAKQ